MSYEFRIVYFQHCVQSYYSTIKTCVDSNKWDGLFVCVNVFNNIEIQFFNQQNIEKTMNKFFER